MFKKELSIIALFLIIILAFSFTTVMADDEKIVTAEEAEDSHIIDNSNISEGLISSNSEGLVSQQQESNLKKSDVYLTGDNITIDYIVDGNLFVIANSVTINSQIGGDAFILAKSVEVGQEGYIFSNLFAMAGNVNIKGVVYDLYSMCENLNISGYVYRDIKVSANSLDIFGTIGRNAFVNCSKINFVNSENTLNEDVEAVDASAGRIGGNLEYSASEELSIPQENVNGSINFTKISNASKEKSIETYIMSLATFVITVSLIWLVGLWIAPKFIKSCDNLLIKKPLPVIGLGLLTPIVFVIAFIILLIISITSSFAMLLLPIFFTLLGISSSVTIISINNIICNKLKIEKALIKFGVLIITTIATWLICLIPFIGGFISLACVIIGTGLVASNLVLKKLP